ncbi:MAG TPA: Lrp/AsnC family transcriptional regulator [Actinomycetota bacterium]|nr:Lrp/AsnC family transcriptional regulator [Actinomycetota bacterium]
MDSTDRRIVALLEKDARLTYGEVGKRVGLAASSVHDRVRKLEKKGVLRGYRADVAFSSVGLPITAFVSLALRPSSPADVPARVAEFPLVESCYSVAGDNSYVLVVRAPTTSALEELLDALRAKLEVVTRSTIVLSTPFERRPMTAEGNSSRP